MKNTIKKSFGIIILVGLLMSSCTDVEDEIKPFYKKDKKKTEGFDDPAPPTPPVKYYD